MITSQEIAWFGGLMDGEGHFGLNGPSPIIQIMMSDRDSIEKVAKLTGRNIYALQDKRFRKDGTPMLPMYMTKVSGYHAIGWMFTLYIFVSNRKKREIRQVIEFWKTCKREARNRSTSGISKEIWDLLDG